MSPKKEPKYLGILIPIVVSFIALAVQWGAVTTKLTLFESGLEKQGESITKMQQDISFIKGKLE